MPQRNRFEFLENHPTSSTDTEPDTGQKPPMPATQSKTSSKLNIPGLTDETPDKLPLERLNVEIPADLHQRLREYCTAKRKTKKIVINALVEYLLDSEGF